MRIGAENDLPALQGLSVVAAGYGLPARNLGTVSVIGPGNIAASRLYHRITGNAHGAQMPPNGPLRPEQIATIKAWIEQGADWPDEASGEQPSAADPDEAAELAGMALAAAHRAKAAKARKSSKVAPGRKARNTASETLT